MLLHCKDDLRLEELLGQLRSHQIFLSLQFQVLIRPPLVLQVLQILLHMPLGFDVLRHCDFCRDCPAAKGS